MFKINSNTCNNLFRRTVVVLISATAFFVLSGLLTTVAAQDAATRTATPPNQNQQMRLDSFRADITVRENGSLDVTETITGAFLIPRHGLFRYIPTDYERNGIRTSIDIHVSDVQLNGEAVSYEVFRDGASKVIKIGDPDVTFDGVFSYDISYSVRRAILFHDEYDEVYWNVTGHEWPVAIPDVRARVTLPGVPQDEVRTDCYTGVFGSTKQGCEIDVINDGVVFRADTFTTLSVRFPKGVVDEPSSFINALFWARDNMDAFAFLVPIVAVIYLFKRWWMYGRDPRKRRVVAPRFAPPNGMRAAEVGTLADVKFHNRDFAAILVELAVRGYIKIHETKEKRLLWKDTVAYEIEKLKEPDETLREYEQLVLNRLFVGGKRKKIKKHDPTMVSARKKAQKALYQFMEDEGYYIKNPNQIRGLYAIIGFVVLVAGLIIAQPIAASFQRGIIYIPFILTGAFIFLFGLIMPKRTKRGARAYEASRGFALFLSKAEKYRLEWQEQENVFERYLPYAITYEVADKWAKVFSFEEMQQQTALWYDSSDGISDMGDFGRRVSSFAGATAAASTPDSGGGSSSGGSGSSGGGFGGGGGGSW